MVPVPEREGFADVFATVRPLLELSPLVRFNVLSTSSVPLFTFTEPMVSTVGLELPVSLPRTSLPKSVVLSDAALPLIGKSIYAVTAGATATVKPEVATIIPAPALPVNVNVGPPPMLSWS